MIPLVNSAETGTLSMGTGFQFQMLISFLGSDEGFAGTFPEPTKTWLWITTYKYRP
jgi:hypothetical protein